MLAAAIDKITDRIKAAMGQAILVDAETLDMEIMCILIAFILDMQRIGYIGEIWDAGPKAPWACHASRDVIRGNNRGDKGIASLTLRK